MPTYVLLAWAATAAFFDWRWHRLPNWLTLGALAAGIVWFSISGELARNGVAAAAAAIALLPAYAAGLMGAGDVKLFAAMGLLAGPAVLLPTLLVAFLVAGAVALALLVRHGKARRRRVPFGVGLALGFILAVEAA